MHQLCAWSEIPLPKSPTSQSHFVAASSAIATLVSAVALFPGYGLSAVVLWSSGVVFGFFFVRHFSFAAGSLEKSFSVSRSVADRELRTRLPSGH